MATTKKHWFHSKSLAAKKAHIKKHPKSKYAKQVHGTATKALVADKHLHGVLKKHQEALHKSLQEHKKSSDNIHHDHFNDDHHKFERDYHDGKVKEHHAAVKKAARLLQAHRKRHGIEAPKLKVHNDKQIERKLKLHKKITDNKEHQLHKQVAKELGW